jgi:phosphomannomutase
MGIVVWIAAAFAGFLVAILVPSGRDRRWTGELIASLLTSAVLALGATALDFGGWREPEPRAALLIVCGSFAAAGAVRLVRLASRKRIA